LNLNDKQFASIDYQTVILVVMSDIGSMFCLNGLTLY